VVLIGDSGQRDPEIYLDVARDHPRRVAAVYIRDLTPGGPRSRAVEALRPVLAELGAELVVADATEAMAVHAAGRGWIPRSVLPEVVRHAADDEA
jgi:phosphatidate phosphatase APP1